MEFSVSIVRHHVRLAYLLIFVYHVSQDNICWVLVAMPIVQVGWLAQLWETTVYASTVPLVVLLAYPPIVHTAPHAPMVVICCWVNA